MQQLLTKDQAWARFVASHGGEQAFRPAVIDNIARMLACGTDILGYAKHECSNPECPHTKVVPFSCNSRFCNTCGKKNTDQWIAQQSEILPKVCDWQHITFTMPSELWEIIEHNRWLLKKLRNCLEIAYSHININNFGGIWQGRKTEESVTPAI